MYCYLVQSDDVRVSGAICVIKSVGGRGVNSPSIKGFNDLTIE
jgi:hypothetical protein